MVNKGSSVAVFAALRREQAGQAADEADSAMTLDDQMAGRLMRGVAVVDHHTARMADQPAVHQYRRRTIDQPGERIDRLIVAALKDEPVHTAVLDHPGHLPALVHRLGPAEQHGVAQLPGSVFDAAHQFGEEGVCQVRCDDADGFGAGRLQRPRRDIGSITKIIGDAGHPGPGRCAGPGTRVAVEDARDETDRDACLLGHIAQPSRHGSGLNPS